MELKIIGVVASWHQPNIEGIRLLIKAPLESLDSKQTKLWVFL